MLIFNHSTCSCGRSYLVDPDEADSKCAVCRVYEVPPESRTASDATHYEILYARQREEAIVQQLADLVFLLHSLVDVIDKARP